MIIKEIHAKAGSISSYLWYVFLVFCWYFLDNRFTTIRADLPQSSLVTLGDWVFRLFLVPLLLAGVFGGIYFQQRFQEEWSIEGFLQAIKTHYWRILVANILSMTVFVIGSIVVVMARGIDPAELEKHKLLEALIYIPYSVINLFWFSAIVVEREIFRGLFRSLRTLFNPFALTIGFLWGLISFADSNGIDFPSGELALPMDGIRAAIVAVARVGAIIYILAVYSKIWGDTAEPAEETVLGEASESEKGLINASFGFTFVSFLPFFHLVALILGLLALKRRGQFIMKAAIACCIGGFFTFFYAFLVAGWLAGRSAPSTVPGYTFLSDTNAELQPQVMLLESGSFAEVQTQLGQSITPESKRPWAFDAALAIAKLQSYDLKGALQDFQFAAEKNPQRSELYYYYGLALLKNNEEEKAAEQFQNAIAHQPKLEGAQQYLTLIQTAYKPSRVVSALSFIIILLMLFTLHEYGHAYAATKLGDDTPQRQGRLTLNPLPHLEVFGSILLPALLLFQQSEIVFGWAKPVQVNPQNFKNPQKDHMIVSFAGPAMNLLISMICLIILGAIMLFVRLFWPGTLSLHLASPFSSVSVIGPPLAGALVILVVFLKQLFYTSLTLGCFNLIPIPPLDGSWIFTGMLPQGPRALFEKARPYASLVFLLLVFTSVFNYVLTIPVIAAWGALQLLVSAMGYG